MTNPPDDKWHVGDAYDAYMGRWSRLAAESFVDWIGARPSAHWLDVGCGTGALTAAICARAEPLSVVACDPSATFVEHARKINADARASFVVADTAALPTLDGGFDIAASGLVVNFLPNPAGAIEAMRRVVRAGGTVAAYVWDYAEGMKLLRHFWDEATALDPRAVAFDEGRRFPLCAPAALAALLRDRGLKHVETGSIEIPMVFASFADCWAPFLGNTGPAPSYVASLDAAGRDRLRDGLRKRVGAERDGSIRLRARAWAVRGIV
jgi:SAM-dependent methyltransferase